MGSEKNNSVRVSVYGKQYNIAGKASRGDILRYAKYVDDKIELLLGGRQQPLTTDIMTLVAMNIAEDLYNIKADRDEALDIIKEKNKEIEGYNRLWDKAKDGYKNARQEYEGAREEILSMEEECESARQEAARLDAENRVLKEKLKDLGEEIENLKNANLQMQLFIPPGYSGNNMDGETGDGPKSTGTKKPAGYNRKKKKNRHKKKSRG